MSGIDSPAAAPVVSCPSISPPRDWYDSMTGQGGRDAGRPVAPHEPEALSGMALPAGRHPGLGGVTDGRPGSSPAAAAAKNHVCLLSSPPDPMILGATISDAGGEQQRLLQDNPISRSHRNADMVSWRSRGNTRSRRRNSRRQARTRTRTRSPTSGFGIGAGRSDHCCSGGNRYLFRPTGPAADDDTDAPRSVAGLEVLQMVAGDGVPPGPPRAGTSGPTRQGPSGRPGRLRASTRASPGRPGSPLPPRAGTRRRPCCRFAALRAP